MFQNMNFMAFLLNGGPVFLLLLLFSLFSIAVIIEKWSSYNSLKRKTYAFQSLLLDKVKAGKLSEAIDLCKLQQSPVAEIYLAALERKGKPKEIIEEAINRKSSNLILFLEKRLIILATTGSITPFIGLFGTVLGIMNAFKTISLSESFSPSLVANPIAEALLNTAGGLFVAIPAVIAYNAFTHLNQNFIRQTEITASEIVENLTETSRW